MKYSRPPQVRMAYIDRLIREGKYPNCVTVAGEFEVHRKTIQKDIDCMRDLGAPLEYDAKQHGYYYTEPNYFLPAISLTQSDMFAFIVNEQILKQYKDAPYYKEIKKVIDKIIQLLPDDIAVDEAANIFSFTNMPASPVNKHHLDVLQKAAYEEKQIKIKYHSQHSNEAHDRTVDPYAIRNQNGTWYLIAFCHSRNEMRIFALNRILAIETTDVDFYKPSSFSIEEYLKDSFGIYRDNKNYHVKLKFSSYQARWIRERQWHKTQKLTALDNGGLILEMEVQGLDEVKRWVLQYGGEVEVVGPEVLKDDVKQEIKKMQQSYFGINSTD